MTDHIGDYMEQKPTMYHQGLYAQSTTKKQRLGTIRELDDGRKFVYCVSTAANLVAGVCLSKAVAPQDATVVLATDGAVDVLGARKVTVTLTGTPTLNLYEDGWLCIKAGTNIGAMYKIRGNTADDVPASGRCTFYLYDELDTAWIANTTIGLYESPYKSVLINPAVANGDATTAERILGIAPRAVYNATPVAVYFWAQTWGLGNPLLDVPAAAGNEADEKFLIAGITAGTLNLSAAGAEPDQPRYGYIIENGDLTDDENSLCFLQIS